MTFQRLRAEMKENKITQRKLAKLLNQTPRTVNRKLGGISEFTRSDMAFISKTLNKSMDYLFGEEDI